MENYHFSRDCKPEWGILVHQLPKDAARRAMRCLPSGIKRKRFDNSGMHVYFLMKERVEESVLLRSIRVDRALYYIYPLVTCLTVYGIHNSAPRNAIKSCLEGNDLPVLEMYQINDTDDCRVVLNVPEVNANFSLTPISLPSQPGQAFSIAFYCRVCREEGHKQYQCRRHESNQSSPNRNDTVSSYIPRNQDSINPNENSPMSSAIHRRQERMQTPSVSRSNQVRENASLRGRQAVGPSTSSAPTAAESRLTQQRMTRNAQATSEVSRRKFAKNKKKGQKEAYPCREIIKIIPKVPGILSPERMYSFLETLHHKKNSLDHAKKFDADIPAIIQQLLCIISYYNQRGNKNASANKDIKTILELCDRLDRQWQAPQS